MKRAGSMGLIELETVVRWLPGPGWWGGWPEETLVRLVQVYGTEPAGWRVRFLQRLRQAPR